MFLSLHWPRRVADVLVKGPFSPLVGAGVGVRVGMITGMYSHWLFYAG